MEKGRMTDLLTIPQSLVDAANAPDDKKLLKEWEKKTDNGGWKINSPSIPNSKRRRDVHTDIRFGACTLIENEQLKKKPFIKRLREKFPEIGSGVICRIVNKLLDQRVIEKDTKFKTKPILVKGRYWRKI
jgi:hypothetical protein|tara:strand:- start:83 stop:472 length:390 start_codon:yes stop_codon:yes gene_type:complete